MFDLYVWQSPRDLDDDGASALFERWQAAGGALDASPFEPSKDVGWFYRELLRDRADLETASDVAPNRTAVPVWLSLGEEPAARVVAIRRSADEPREDANDVFSLATKYDLVVFDAQAGRVYRPLEIMTAYASATFWPKGAIRAAVVGGLGGVAALIAWMIGIPVVSGLVAAAGGFMFVMAVITFVHEGRKRVRGG